MAGVPGFALWAEWGFAGLRMPSRVRGMPVPQRPSPQAIPAGVWRDPIGPTAWSALATIDGRL